MNLTLLLLVVGTLALTIWIHLRLRELTATVDELNQAQEAMLLDIESILQPLGMLLDNLHHQPSPRFMGAVITSVAGAACGSDASMEMCARRGPPTTIEEVSEEEEEEEEEEEMQGDVDAEEQGDEE